MYQYSATGSALTPGPHVVVQYIVQGIAATNQVAVKVYSGTAEIALSTISRVSDPAQYGACRNPASNMLKMPGQVTYDLGMDPAVTAPYPITNSLFEKPVCSVGVGLQLCPNNSYQVGLNPDGTPICSLGNKNVCPPGYVAVQAQDSGTGGFTVSCMPSSCASNTVAGVNRLGFVSPSGFGLPIDPVNCVIIQPKPGCELMAKTTIDSGSTNAGFEDCTTTGSVPAVGAPPPPPPPGCSGTTESWLVGSYSCQGPVTAAASGSPAQNISSTGPNSGNASFSCVSGSWVGPAAGYTCTAPAPQMCQPKTLTWGTGPICSYNWLTAQGVGTSTGPINSTAPAGTANFSCSASGNWVLGPIWTCTAPASCPAGTSATGQGPVASLTPPCNCNNATDTWNGSTCVPAAPSCTLVQGSCSGPTVVIPTSPTGVGTADASTGHFIYPFNPPTATSDCFNGGGTCIEANAIVRAGFPSNGLYRLLCHSGTYSLTVNYGQGYGSFACTLGASPPVCPAGTSTSGVGQADPSAPGCSCNNAGEIWDSVTSSCTAALTYGCSDSDGVNSYSHSGTTSAAQCAETVRSTSEACPSGLSVPFWSFYSTSALGVVTPIAAGSNTCPTANLTYHTQPQICDSFSNYSARYNGAFMGPGTDSTSPNSGNPCYSTGIYKVQSVTPSGGCPPGQNLIQIIKCM